MATPNPLVDRLAEQITQAVLTAVRAELAKAGTPYGVGKVKAITPGAGYAAAPLITVTHNGADVQLAQCASYVPAVGDVVMLARHRNQLIILDKIIGGPHG
jgi:hypothetical protein